MVKIQKQRGVVLVVAIVFLVALTGIAAALMQNTTSDMKMSGASEEKVTAVQETISASDEVVYKQIQKADGENKFTKELASYPYNEGVSAKKTTANISVANPNKLEASCPHMKSASSIQVFTCNVLTIEVNRKYGRHDNQNITVNSGISQQLLNVGG
jgi:Tfp pilus assembly protein PilX